MTRLTKIVCLSMLLLALFAASANGASRTGSGITGRVSCSGAPSAGADVRVEAPDGTFTDTFSGSNGAYTLDLAPGSYYATVVSMPDCIFHPLWVPVTVSAGKYTKLNFAF